jgi:hypothetical protein
MQIVIKDGIRSTFQKKTPENQDNSQQKENRHKNDTRLFYAVPNIPIADKPA